MNHPAFSWSAFLPTHVINNVATLGPLGYWTKAPGTVGSAAGILFYLVFLFPLGMVGEFALTVFMLYLAVGFCGEAEMRMFKKDPSEVILDEFAVIPICFLGLKPYMEPGNIWLFMLAGFILFRFFDVLKPLGIKRLQNYPGGLGVVLDDVAAAIATCICLHLLLWWGQAGGWWPGAA